jgi:deoxyribodipyrimidine photo-lyase
LDPSWRANENVNRVLLLEPSHFKANPVSTNVLNFILELSKNIPELHVYVGEIAEIISLYTETCIDIKKAIISKEHQAFEYYPGIKDEREWMFPSVTGYYPSFFKFWQKCQKSLFC